MNRFVIFNSLCGLLVVVHGTANAATMNVFSEDFETVAVGTTMKEMGWFSSVACETCPDLADVVVADDWAASGTQSARGPDGVAFTGWSRPFDGGTYMLEAGDRVEFTATVRDNGGDEMGIRIWGKAFDSWLPGGAGRKGWWWSVKFNELNSGFISFRIENWPGLDLVPAPSGLTIADLRISIGADSVAAYYREHGTTDWILVSEHTGKYDTTGGGEHSFGWGELDAEGNITTTGSVGTAQMNPGGQAANSAGGSIDAMQVNVDVIPEPASLVLLSLGFFMMQRQRTLYRSSDLQHFT